MVALAVAEVEAVRVVLWTPSTAEVAVVVVALQVLRRGGLEVEEGTSYLAVVEGLLRLAWTGVAVGVRLWALLKAVVEGRLFLWQEAEGGLSYVEGEEGEEALPLMAVEVVVLAFVVHF